MGTECLLRNLLWHWKLEVRPCAENDDVDDGLGIEREYKRAERSGCGDRAQTCLR